MTSLPPWAISDDLALTLFPDEGFFTDYSSYQYTATDAPVIFHLGTVLTMVAVAAANCSLKVEAEIEGRSWDIPLQFWSMVVAPSGARKSQAMAAAPKLLRRALKGLEDRKGFQLPLDGSLEAWTKHLASCNNALSYRTEAATLFEQARRGHFDGLKSWMMTCWEGEEFERQTLKEDNSFIVERPRLSFLGGIPPDTFKEQTHRGDWRSGFLARLTFFAGDRTRYMRIPHTDDLLEMELSRWLYKVAAQSSGTILIPRAQMYKVSDWIVRKVEDRRKELPSEMYSHLNRFPAVVYRIAGLYALGTEIRALKPGKTLVVGEHHVDRAIKTAEALMISAQALFQTTISNIERAEGMDLLTFLKVNKDKGRTHKEIDDYFPQWSIRYRNRILSELQEDGQVTKVVIMKRRRGEGRPPIRWKYT